MNRFIILAAGTGTRLRPLTKNLPKCMVPLHGIPLIQWQVQAARKAGFKDIIVVAGHYHENLKVPGTRMILNPHFASTNMVASLLCATDFFGDSFIMSYGDIVCHPLVIQKLLDSPHDISVVIDLGWKEYWQQRFTTILSDAESLQFNQQGEITSIGQPVSEISEIQGQYIGLVKFQGNGVKQLLNHTDAEKINTMYMTDLLYGLIKKGCPIHAVPVKRNWLEIDSLSDLKLAETLTMPEQEKLFWKN